MKRTIALCLLLVAACSGGSAKKSVSPDASASNIPSTAALACSKAASVACGGDIVGTWKLAGVCSHSMTQQQIIDQNSSLFGESVGQCGLSSDILDTGYAKFRPDGTWQIDEIIGIAIGFSESCLSGIGQSCDSVRSYTNVDAGISLSKTCQSADGVCQCSCLQDANSPNSGSYTTDGTSYHLYDDEGFDNATRRYCIQGDVISVWVTDQSVGFGEGVAIAIRTTETVADIDASVVLPMFDASADAPIDNARRDAPDVGTDVSRPDATAGRPNADAGAPDNRIADVKQDDASPLDAMPIDATPVPLSTMPPSMAATCQAAATAPCGGDLTGNWNVVGICDQWLNMTEFLADWGGNCPTSGDYIDHGTVALNADGTCLFDEVTTYEIDKSVSCLAQKSMTCDSMNQTFADAVGTNEMISGECALSTADNCHCEKVFSSPDTCKYMTTATTITTVNLDGTNEWGPYPYCVQGNALTIFIPAWSATGTALDDNAAFFMTRDEPH